MLFKNWLKKGFRACGLEVSRIATSDHLLYGRLKELLERLHIDTVIDVGANEGQFLHLLSKIGFEGDVLSFEPVPELYQRLQSFSLDRKRWRQFPYACGSRDGTTVINIAESTDYSSILKPNAFCLTENSRARTIRSEAVEMRRLDLLMRDIYPNLSEKRILLKIDTQGYDTEVFLGASRILDSIRLIQVEIPVIPLYDNALSMPRALEAYLSAGFCVSGLFPVSHSEDRLFIVEYDCLLVNRRLSDDREGKDRSVPTSLP